MARRVPILLLLLSPAVALYVQELEAGIHAGLSQAPLAVAAVGDENDGFLCGECPGPGPGSGDDRQHGAFSQVFSKRDTAAARGGADASPKHGLGPVLSSLSVSLILSRPPPAGSGSP